MKRWFPYIKPYLPYFILGPLCMIVEVIGEVMMPKFLSGIIDYGVDYGAGLKEKSAVIEWLLQHLGSNWVFVICMMAAMIITALLMMLGGIGGAYFGTRASVNFAADLRLDVYRKIQQYSFANIDKFSTGSLITRLTNDVTQLQGFVMMMLRMALRAPGMMIGALIMAILLNPSLTIILAVSVPLMLLSVSVLIVKGFSRFSVMQGKIDDLNSTVRENVTNVRVVKSFVRENHEIRKFRASNTALKEAGFRSMSTMILISPVMTFFMNATTIAVLWFGGNMLVNNTGMSTGELTAFITYISQILSSLMMVTMMFMQFSRAMASGRRILEVLDETPDVSDENAASPDLTVQQGSIEFRHVGFRYYKNSEEQVLHDISFSVLPGQTVGIIGSTGCGKTTLVSLIPRLYDVDEGAVLIDGVNVKDYSLYHLREGVGMVLQKNELFSGTIADNLRWGNEDATMEQLRRAAADAQADTFVSEFKDGYESGIEQSGTNVSGGQKQRLCIARALLKKPKILILDDSTSAVDTATEQKIRQSFAERLSDTTTIIIAQRITSVMNADKIIVMDNGSITGIGTHDELLTANEAYREIYQSQTAEKEA